MVSRKALEAWQMVAPDQPLVRKELPIPDLAPGEILIEIAGCGLCHTDLSFLHGGVRTRKAPPLTLGHEFTGTVIATGAGAESQIGRAVLVPAVLPCGDCDLCRSGRGRVCRRQVMPGNDIDGGFATHAVVPERFVCSVNPGSYELWELSVIADAVTTPYQAMKLGKVTEGDVVVILGVGGIGTYGVQIGAALGSTVIAVDVDARKLDRIRNHGASALVDASGLDTNGVKEAVRGAVGDLGLSRYAWKVFEMSGTAPGQAAAYELLTFGGTIGFTGFTMEKIPVRLGNLMAFDASVFGHWGCLPELYPEALDLVVSGKVQIRPFIERFPLDRINDVIARARAHELEARAVLTP